MYQPAKSDEIFLRVGNPNVYYWYISFDSRLHRFFFGFESFLFRFFSNHITANFRESFPKPQCLCATLPGDLTNTTFSSHKRIVPRLPTSLCLLVLFCYISKKGFSRGFQKNRSLKYYLFGTFLIHTNVLMTF